MLDQRLEDGEGHRRHVGAELRRLDDMERVADARHQDLGGEGVVRVDRLDVPDEPHAVGADVVEPSDEGRDVGRTRLGRQERLRGGETERHVDADLLLREPARRRQPVLGQRTLHDNVRVEFRKHAPLVHHPGRVAGDRLHAHGAVHRFANLLQEREEVASLLGDQARVGGDPIDGAPTHGLADFREIRRIQEDFHLELRLVGPLSPLGLLSPFVRTANRLNGRNRHNGPNGLPKLAQPLRQYQRSLRAGRARSGPRARAPPSPRGARSRASPARRATSYSRSRRQSRCARG